MSTSMNARLILALWSTENLPEEHPVLRACAATKDRYSIRLDGYADDDLNRQLVQFCYKRLTAVRAEIRKNRESKRVPALQHEEALLCLTAQNMINFEGAARDEVYRMMGLPEFRHTDSDQDRLAYVAVGLHALDSVIFPETEEAAAAE